MPSCRPRGHPILPYAAEPASFRTYDPRAAGAAARVTRLLRAEAPGAAVHRVGSTAVPGLGGKGIVDLAVGCPAGARETVKRALGRLGFAPQTTRDPFPETRPMRTGAVEHEGAVFRLHVHVLEEDGAELRAMLAFRERLRADPELVRAYERAKQAVLAAGATDPVRYAEVKGAFVRAILAGGPAPAAPTSGGREPAAPAPGGSAASDPESGSRIRRGRGG